MHMIGCVVSWTRLPRRAANLFCATAATRQLGAGFQRDEGMGSGGNRIRVRDAAAARKGCKEEQSPPHVVNTLSGTIGSSFVLGAPGTWPPSAKPPPSSSTAALRCDASVVGIAGSITTLAEHRFVTALAADPGPQGGGARPGTPSVS